jgi:hypothetical protein
VSEKSGDSGSGGKKPSWAAVHPVWWQIEDPEEQANEVIAISDGLVEDNSHRRSRYLANLQLYELRQLGGLNAGSYNTEDELVDQMLPVIRSICDTVQADIAGRQRPVPMFMTSGADWKTRRRAKKLGKFVEAVLHQPQGTYVDGWELAVDVFLDACIYGTGCMHVYVDEETEKVVIERVQPEELNVDPREAECGHPKNFFREYQFDADELFHAFKDEEEFSGEGGKDRLRSAIDSATVSDKKLIADRSNTTRIARSVYVREAIRVPIAKDEPGVRTMAIPGLRLKTEEWNRSEPYVFVRWSRERRGFWGIALVDEVKRLADSLNENFERMHERMRLCANKRTYVPRDSNITKQELEANEAENIIYYDGDKPPLETAAPALTQADIDWHQIVEGLCYKMTGVSQTSATARKEPGIDSGVAIRTMQDLATKRFSVKARYAYEYPFVALARKIVDAVAEYVEATGNDITVRLPQRRGLREIEWADVSLESEFDVQVAPISSLPSDPAGRLATVGELFSQKVISMQTYKRLLDWPDLEHENARDNAEWEYVESVIEGFLDAEEGDEDFQFTPPDGYLSRKPQALMQVAAAYFEARRDGAPEYNLELLRKYMMALGDAINKMLAPPPPVPGAAPMTPGAPAGAAAAPPPLAPPMAPGGAPGAPGPMPMPPPPMPVG